MKKSGLTRTDLLSVQTIYLIQVLNVLPNETNQVNRSGLARPGPTLIRENRNLEFQERNKFYRFICFYFYLDINQLSCIEALFYFLRVKLK